jgi:hypothetical protein
MQANAANAGEDCDIVSKVLGRPIQGAGAQNEETTIQETNNTDATTSDEQLDQAYTCVRITNSEGDFLGQLNHMAKLCYLDLRNCQLSPKAGKALAETMRQRNQIAFLNLADNGLGDAGVTDVLRVLMNMETLTELDLSCNHFGAATADVVADFISTNRVIYSLNISKNNIGDAGAISIARSLEKNDSLTRFDMSSCRVSDPGAVAVAVALRSNWALTCLKLGDNFLTRGSGYAMIEHLRGNEQLRKVDLSATQIDHFVIEAIASLCRRNIQLQKEINLQPMKKEIVQLSIQRTKMPEAETRLAGLQEQRTGLEMEVADLDEGLESTQSNADSNIFHLRKQIQATRESIADEQASMINLEQEHERLMSDYEERYTEIMGSCEKEKLLAKKGEDDLAEMERQIDDDTEQTAAKQDEMRSQIQQIRQLIEQTKGTSLDRDALKDYDKPELPDFMQPPRDTFFVVDELDHMRNQEAKPKKKKKGKKKRGKSPKRKGSPRRVEQAAVDHGGDDAQISEASTPGDAATAPAPAAYGVTTASSSRTKPVIKRPASARRKSPLKRSAKNA